MSLLTRIDALESKLKPRKNLAERVLAERRLMSDADAAALMTADPAACARWPASAKFIRRFFVELVRQPDDARQS